MAHVRWGIAGPGRMAATMAEAFARVTNGSLVAVGSRSAERAESFAATHHLPRAHSSYDALIEDPEVDALYIATPHAQHTDIALAALAAGKPILVEKAFTASLADTERVVAAARASGTFAMEAMWARFNPAMAHVRKVIAEGEIGEVRGCQGDLFAYRPFEAGDRLFDPAKGGGAMLDLGVYVVSLAQHILGDPSLVQATGGRYSSGVEGEFSVLLGYPDGRSGTLAGAFTCYGPGRFTVLGTKGWIDIHPRFHRGASITVWRERTPETLTFSSGYEYEIEHVGECLAAGLMQSPIMPLDDTVSVQRIMETALAQF